MNLPYKTMEPQKSCSKCKIVKVINHQNFATYVQKGIPKVRPECRECSKAMCRAYKAGNKGKISSYNKTYKAAHQDDTRTYNRGYFQKRRDTDPEYRVMSSHKSRVSMLIKQENKATKTMKLLECSHKKFIRWLEFQLVKCPQWTFANYGSVWHLDHIKPCASFNLLDHNEQKQCFHWSNYRPLDKIENIQKGDKIDDEIMRQHKVIVAEFLVLMKEEKEEYGMEYSLYK